LPGIGACDPTLPKVGAPKARILGVDEVLLAHDQLKPALSACLAKSLHERTTVNLMLGIQPNGSICGATLDTSQLSATTLACLSQTLRRYRFPKADTLTEVVFFPRFIPPSHD
jgi:hypothetical protein